MDRPPEKPVQLKAVRPRHLRAADAAAIAHLATQATLGIANMAEGVHQSVLGTLGASAGKAPAQTSGITGLVYSAVRGVTKLAGLGLETALDKLQPLFDAADHTAAESPQREAVLAALNGVIGDRLAASGNPLATPMRLRRLPESAEIGETAVTGKILLLAHGLCMNDLQWKLAPPASAAQSALSASSASPPSSPAPGDHGTALAQALGYTPVYLRYNTGLHTSQNGRELSRQLAQLVADWPVPVTELSVVAHSMGGLVVRSAVHCATEEQAAWLPHLKNIAFLGTPHHGAPLERAGNWVDVILGSTPYSRPFGKLAQLRSAGITDLRFGHVLDDDWQGHDRFRKQPDARVPVPLPFPERVASFTIAATLASQRGALAERLLGDGLVPLPSALGQHGEAHRTLAFHKDRQRILYNTSHMALLNSPQVAQQLLAWFGKGD